MIGSCGSSPPAVNFEVFQDNQAYHTKFIGIWTENTIESGDYRVYEFRDDGTGFSTNYRNNKVSSTTSLRYKTSDFQIAIHFNNSGYNNIANYRFEDDNVLSLVQWRNGYSPAPFHRSGNALVAESSVEGALTRAANTTLKNVLGRSKIAIVYITAQDRSTTEYIAGELEFIWVNAGYTIIDRSQLDRIRREQNFQMSGEVDDETAVSIGKFIGADIIVTGRVDGEGNLRRLRLRALDTQTAQVVGVASERI
ncbi:MAG: CsgG/HfaB family protein [Treponema sp.]|nr:CsgG/HfaB family protein [Treponema sp.]